MSNAKAKFMLVVSVSLFVGLAAAPVGAVYAQEDEQATRNTRANRVRAVPAAPETAADETKAQKRQADLAADKQIAGQDATLVFESLDPTSAEIAAVQKETALLEAKIKRAQARKELLQAMTPEPTRGQQKPVAHLEVAVPASGEIGVIDESIAPPKLVVIYGSGSRLFATVKYESGLRQDIRAGDVLEGGFTVARITSGDVTLARAGKSYLLRTFVGKQPTANPTPTDTRMTPSSVPMMGAMPTMPPGQPPVGMIAPAQSAPIAQSH